MPTLRTHHTCSYREGFASAPLRIVRWRGLRPLPAPESPVRWEAVLLRRACSGGFAVCNPGVNCSLCGESMTGVGTLNRVH